MAAVWVKTKKQAYLSHVAVNGDSYHLYRAVRKDGEWDIVTKKHIETDSDLK